MAQVTITGWEVGTATHVEVNERLDTANVPVCLKNRHQMCPSSCLGTLSLPSRDSPQTSGEKAVQTAEKEQQEHYPEKEPARAELWQSSVPIPVSALPQPARSAQIQED